MSVRGSKRIASLRAGLADSDPWVRSSSAESLGFAGAKQSAKWLVPLLGDRNREVRFRTAEAIGNSLRGKGAAPRALVQATEDSDYLVRVVAIEALGKIRDTRSRASLWAALDDRSPLVRRYSASAIGECGHRRDVARLLVRLRKETSSSSKVGYHEALFRLGERDRLVDLLESLGHANYRVRCAVANTVADLRLRSSERRLALEALRVALKSEETVAAASSIRAAVRSLRVRA